MRLAFAAAGLSLACVSAVVAAAGFDPIVATRQSSMKEMAAAAKTIAGMFDGRLAYDAAAFKAAAKTIRDRTGPALIAEFPSATLGAPSGARLEIDQARPEFEALARHMGTLASALAAKAERAPANITDDMRMGSGPAMDGGSLLGKRPAAEADPARLPAEHLLHLILQDCSNCHSKFRQKVL
ncbi:cytochrome c [Mesorhizobium sp. YC-39]|uniref:cytochrome c n=1 Tax=unclassified Mesorhizobium TaxID=325217 RepID=UPI0021E970D3|nr:MULTISPECIES: cytochrome c [unclassified Mesorhizobium]MCV3210888.1 cytochrome c [Mesorhizobium sp. YC-2]MCV3231122.1 cytochrome c [Mesorhizobium sp. YC-39]